ncbi:MAG: hypothetical protein IT349_19380 [Candidatus Eisenbacteria bacterium]|nr:hypothetical protein [Candidatus Eisenbacteria bacterium]
MKKIYLFSTSFEAEYTKAGARIHCVKVVGSSDGKSADRRLRFQCKDLDHARALADAIVQCTSVEIEEIPAI